MNNNSAILRMTTQSCMLLTKELKASLHLTMQSNLLLLDKNKHLYPQMKFFLIPLKRSF